MRRLSEAVQAIRYAKCNLCGEVFVDDMLFIGSLRCPNGDCHGHGLWRDYKPLAEELAVFGDPNSLEVQAAEKFANAFFGDRK